jgi:hypothetical protein
MSRTRFAGDAELVLGPVCDVAKSPNWLQHYTEDMNGQLQQAKIIHVGSMWHKLLQIWPSLSFNQGWLEAMFETVAWRMTTVWGRALNPSELKEWKVAISKQFRAQARHLVQALSKNRKWAMTIKDLELAKNEKPEAIKKTKLSEDAEEEEEEEEDAAEAMESEQGEPDDEEEEAEEEAEEEEPEDVEEPEGFGAEEEAEEEAEDDEPAKRMKGGMKKPAAMKKPASAMKKPAAPSPAVSAPSASAPSASAFIGYDSEFKRAWRIAFGDKNGAKDWSVSINRPPHAKKSDLAIAKFPNGDEVPLPTLTVEELDMEDIVRQSTKGVMWEGLQDGARVWISKRADRTPLLCLYRKEGDSAKQICQMTIKTFGDPASEDSSG